MANQIQANQTFRILILIFIKLSGMIIIIELFAIYIL